jgi:hypothetical protein
VSFSETEWGKGAKAIDWWISEDCPAELYAFAEISTLRVWLFTKRQLESHAQQQSNGRLHIYMYTDPEVGSRAYERNGDELFSDFLFANRVTAIF